jgi:hypothetical protein
MNVFLICVQVRANGFCTSMKKVRFVFMLWPRAIGPLNVSGRVWQPRAPRPLLDPWGRVRGREVCRTILDRHSGKDTQHCIKQTWNFNNATVRSLDLTREILILQPSRIWRRVVWWMVSKVEEEHVTMVRNMQLHSSWKKSCRFLQPKGFYRLGI